MSTFIDIFHTSLIKTGEELCGDMVKTFKTEDKSVVVLSDGLGSGVKAHILATLTAQIISTMMEAEIELEDVMDTVLNTLPTCKVRKIAYATFTIVEINRKTYTFRVINFDNPPLFFIKNGKIQTLETQTIEILKKKISITEGKLEKGDFLAAISDGVLYAGAGLSSNFGWGWKDIAIYVEDLLRANAAYTHDIVRKFSDKIYELYNGKMGDDSTIVGVYIRKRLDLISFSGPPEDERAYNFYAEKFMSFNGRRAVCGGTTMHLVARWIGVEVEPLLSTMTKDLPPIGRLPKVDLVTEGIVTLNKALEYLRNSKGEIAGLPSARDAAVYLAEEWLKADYVYILSGMGINKASQTAMKPTRISLRKSITEDMAAILRSYQKEVDIEYC